MRGWLCQWVGFVSGFVCQWVRVQGWQYLLHVHSQLAVTAIDVADVYCPPCAFRCFRRLGNVCASRRISQCLLHAVASAAVPGDL